MNKQAKVVMLPTEKALDRNKAPIFIDSIGRNLAYNSRPTHIEYKDCEYQHLYLVSDDEIKDREWCYGYEEKKISQFVDLSEVGIGKGAFLKVIATTDRLINCDVCDGRGVIKDVLQNTSAHYDGFETPVFEDESCEDCTLLPKIPESFIKAYVEANGEIDEVQVELMENPVDYGVDPAYFGDDSHVLKLREDNTVIIHPVKQSGTLSPQQIVEKMGWDWYDTESSARRVAEWCSENMKA